MRNSHNRNHFVELCETHETQSGFVNIVVILKLNSVCLNNASELLQILAGLVRDSTLYVWLTLLKKPLQHAVVVVLRSPLIINWFAPSCINLVMMVKKTVGPILTEVVGIGTSQMQEMGRHLFKAVSGWRKAPKNHFLNSYHNSLFPSRGKLRFSVIYRTSDGN